MRSIFAILASATIVSGCERFSFEDELCSKPCVECEEKSGDPEITTVTKLEGSFAWIPGNCVQFGTPYKFSQKYGDSDWSDVTEIHYTWGITGGGQHGGHYLTYGKDNTLCEFDASKILDGSKTGDDLKTYFRSKSSADNTNICTPTQLYGGFKGKKTSPKGYFTMTLCGPVPGAVWGIILSTLGLIFSFAGLGLAAAAGK